MHKKLLAIALVVWMLVLGGVRLKADNCEQIGHRTRSNCEGDNCYKNGSTSPHLIVQIFHKMRCWTNGGFEYTTEEPGDRYNSGCC